MTAAMTASHGISPTMLPKPTELTMTVGTLRRSTPPVMTSARPRAIPRVPSVTMSGGTFARATRNPLSSPQASPQPMATRAPMMAEPQPWPPPMLAITLSATTPLKTSTLPIDRSMPPVMITKVIPTARTARMAVFCTIPRMLNTVRKALGLRIEKMTTITASTMMICSACSRASRASRPVGSSSVGAAPAGAAPSGTGGGTVVCSVMTGSPASRCPASCHPGSRRRSSPRPAPPSSYPSPGTWPPGGRAA